jgi:flagellar motor switch protein FliN/FliY
MASTNIDTVRLVDLLNEAAATIGRNLGDPSLFVGSATAETDPMEFVPGEGAVAVAARMRGLEGTLVLAISAEMAARILNGPLGGNGIVGAADNALRGASAVLDAVAPRALRLEDVREVPPNEMFSQAGDAWFFSAAPLFGGVLADGEDPPHLASLAVLLLDPAEVAAAEEAMADAGELTDFGGAADSATDLYSPPQTPVGRNEVSGFDPFAGAEASVNASQLRLLHDVEMEVTVELGRTKMMVRNILGLTPGSVIELDRAAGAPVDLLVNGTLIGRGEVVVIDEEFGVRISEIVGRTED